jgi:hypothetical protein
MAKDFFQRLRNYYLDVAAVLRGEAKPAAIFPNATDVGISRERVYAEFLRQHAPSKCNVFFGGFIFGDDGTESKQLDVIITTDTTPRFDFHNKDGSGKSFSPVEGTLGAVSIKSMLNKNEIEDALTGIASIPNTTSIEGRVAGFLNLSGYEDWPYKVIYSTDAIASDTLLQHINNFYAANPQIPIFRRPNVIHVSGKYVIFRAITGMQVVDVTTNTITTYPEGTFILQTRDSDLQGIVWALDGLQQRATASTHILYNYGELINRVNNLPSSKPDSEQG